MIGSYALHDHGHSQYLHQIVYKDQGHIPYFFEQFDLSHRHIPTYPPQHSQQNQYTYRDCLEYAVCQFYADTVLITRHRNNYSC